LGFVDRLCNDTVLIQSRDLNKEETPFLEPIVTSAPSVTTPTS